MSTLKLSFGIEMLQLQEREEMDRVLCGIDAIRGVITEFYIALEYLIILKKEKPNSIELSYWFR